MVAKTIALSCPECGIEYSITSTNWESIQFCPFCGDGNVLPYDDIDDEDVRDRLDEDDFDTLSDDD
jgi:hypothetical protein